YCTSCPKVLIGHPQQKNRFPLTNCGNDALKITIFDFAGLYVDNASIDRLECRMFRKISGFLILVAVLLSVISPVNLTFIHVPDNNMVLITFDVCHASSPLQPVNTESPSYPEQICCSLSIPGFAGFYTASRSFFKPTL